MLTLHFAPQVAKKVRRMNNDQSSAADDDECSSGWTSYLEKSWISPSSYYEDEDGDYDTTRVVKYQEEEDMSMVSDASSAPPHFLNHDYSSCFLQYHPAAENARVMGVIGREWKNRQDEKKQRMMLDDTATSKPVTLTATNIQEADLYGSQQ